MSGDILASVSKRPLGCLLEVVETLVLTLVIFLVIQNFVAQPFTVKGSSMERTLEPGQYVLIDKLTPRFEPYKRGDIVVLGAPAGSGGASSVPFIKRVIGVAGDTVELRGGAVYVNGVKLDEPYVYDLQPTDQTTGATSWLVGAGQLLVFGDHREVSDDSRFFGPVPIGDVIGRAWLRYWPANVFGVLWTPD